MPVRAVRSPAFQKSLHPTQKSNPAYSGPAYLSHGSSHASGFALPARSACVCSSEFSQQASKCLGTGPCFPCALQSQGRWCAESKIPLHPVHCLTRGEERLRCLPASSKLAKLQKPPWLSPFVHASLLASMRQEGNLVAKTGMSASPFSTLHSAACIWKSLTSIP